MTWNGPDRLPAIIVFNGLNQTLRCINLDVRNTQGGESESTGMTGIYVSSDTRGLGGTVKTTIDQVAIDGPHLGVQIGGYITYTGQAAPQFFTLNLIANQFNRNIQVDGQLTIASIGNTAGSNQVRWEVNNPASTVHSIADGMKWLTGPSGGSVDQPTSLGASRESGPLAPVVGEARSNSRRNVKGEAIHEGSMLLRATTTPFSPGLILSHSCAAQSATMVKGATASMVCSASPRSDPASVFVWDCFPGTASVTLRLCNIGNSRAAPSATSFNLSLTR